MPSCVLFVPPCFFVLVSVCLFVCCFVFVVFVLWLWLWFLFCFLIVCAFWREEEKKGQRVTHTQTTQRPLSSPPPQKNVRQTKKQKKNNVWSVVLRVFPPCLLFFFLSSRPVCKFKNVSCANSKRTHVQLLVLFARRANKSLTSETSGMEELDTLESWSCPDW